jgi:hypothetical protein
MFECLAFTYVHQTLCTYMEPSVVSWRVFYFVIQILLHMYNSFEAEIA